MWLIKIFICEKWSICQLARNIEIYLSMQVGAHEAAETQTFFPNTVAKSLEVCDPWGLGVSGWLRQWWLTLLWESQSLGLESKDCGCQGRGQSVKNLVGKRSVIFPKARGNSLEESQVWVIGKEHYISDCSSVNTVGARVEWQFTACVRKQYSVGEGGGWGWEGGGFQVRWERSIIWAFSMTEGPHSRLQKQQFLRHVSSCSPSSSSPHPREPWADMGEEKGSWVNGKQTAIPHAKLQNSWDGLRWDRKEIKIMALLDWRNISITKTEKVLTAKRH